MFLRFFAVKKLKRLKKKKNLNFGKTNFITSLQIYSQVISGWLLMHVNQVINYVYDANKQQLQINIT